MNTTTDYIVHFYAGQGFKKHYLNLESVKQMFDRIYEQNNLSYIRMQLISETTGSHLEEKRLNGLLPANSHVIKIIKDHTLQPGEYNRIKGSYVNIAAFQLLNKKIVAYDNAEPDINYQIAYTIAHETLHHLLDTIEHFYDIKDLNVFNLTIGGPAGYKDHAIHGWNLLQPGKDARGHNNYMGIPISASSPDAGKMEHILPNHAEAIQHYLDNIGIPQTSDRYELVKKDIRNQLVSYQHTGQKV